MDREAKTVNDKLACIENNDERVKYLRGVIERNVQDAVFGGTDIVPIHQNSIQTVAAFVRRLDRGTVFAAGMLFSLGIVTFFAARR